VRKRDARRVRSAWWFARRPIRASVFLFPITSQRPRDERLFLSISQIECRRAGLDFPCWIVLDEYNRVELDKALDFESTRPLGSFSLAFLKKIALAVKDAAAARRLTGVSRS
jgi:hypothetical protein